MSTATVRYTLPTSSPEATWRAGTTAPETEKATVLAPSHGPASWPCVRRVRIWHPVSDSAVHSPRPAKAMCSAPSDRARGTHASVAASAPRPHARTSLPLRGARYSHADRTAPARAPAPRATNTVPTRVASRPAARLATLSSVDPSATSTAPHAPMASMYARPSVRLVRVVRATRARRRSAPCAAHLEVSVPPSSSGAASPTAPALSPDDAPQSSVVAAASEAAVR